MKVSKGKKFRDYQNDTYMSEGQLIEVWLSPTQFAEAITSFNIGEGVPCTLKHVVGDKFNTTTRQFREECPERNFRKEANIELKDEMAELGKRIAKMSKDAQELLTSKGQLKVGEKKQLLDELQGIVTEVESNIPFVHECFNESVNKTVTEAKGEIDATYQVMREKLGDKVLSGEIEIPMLEE